MAAIPYTIQERIPSVSEHRMLWEAVGWGMIDTEMSRGSLFNSLYGVVVTVDDEPVGRRNKNGIAFVGLFPRR